MTTVSKNVFIDRLDDIVDEYNNKYHKTIIMRHDDVKDNLHIDFGEEVNDKDPKSKVGDHVRILKYRNIFGKGYTPNWSEEVFVIKEVKNTVRWKNAISDHNGEKNIL